MNVRRFIAISSVEEEAIRSYSQDRRHIDLLKATLAGEAEFAAALSWEEIQELLA
jgi:hypothetical protein